MDVNVADTKTTFRLDQIEGRLTTLSNRTHDIATLSQECKLRLDAADLDKRLRNIEAWISEQKGKDMQNRIIMGGIALLVSIIGGGLVELAVRHL